MATLDTQGFLPERASGAVRVYDVIRYGAVSLRHGSGLEAHHGVLDAWLKNNFVGYSTNDAPAIMLTSEAHARANKFFNAWATERFGGTANVDWTVVSQDGAMELAKQTVIAADVLQSAQTNYFATFWYYMSQLPPPEVVA